MSLFVVQHPSSTVEVHNNRKYFGNTSWSNGAEFYSIPRRWFNKEILNVCCNFFIVPYLSRYRINSRLLNRDLLYLISFLRQGIQECLCFRFYDWLISLNHF